MRRFQAVRLLLALVGTLMLLGGLLALLLSIHGTPDDYGYVPACGSAVRPLLPPGPAVAPIYAEQCAQLQDERRQLAIPFVITGLFLTTATALARPTPQDVPSPAGFV